RPQPFHVGVFSRVGTLHAVADIEQDFGNSAHSDAADADEMNRADVERDAQGLGGNHAAPFLAICSTTSARRNAASGLPSDSAAAARRASSSGAPRMLCRWRANMSAERSRCCTSHAAPALASTAAFSV